MSNEQIIKKLEAIEASAAIVQRDAAELRVKLSPGGLAEASPKRGNKKPNQEIRAQARRVHELAIRKRAS